MEDEVTLGDLDPQPDTVWLPKSYNSRTRHLFEDCERFKGNGSKPKPTETQFEDSPICRICLARRDDERAPNRGDQITES